VPTPRPPRGADRAGFAPGRKPSRHQRSRCGGAALVPAGTRGAGTSAHGDSRQAAERSLDCPSPRGHVDRDHRRFHHVPRRAVHAL